MLSIEMTGVRIFFFFFNDVRNGVERMGERYYCLRVSSMKGEDVML